MSEDNAPDLTRKHYAVIYANGVISERGGETDANMIPVLTEFYSGKGLRLVEVDQNFAGQLMDIYDPATGNITPAREQS